MTSLFNVEKPTSVATEIARLRAENQALIEELAQCQTDKDFVWSLWKRLQVTSPDVTQAISIVLQREREKSESKDRKVLEILRGKDDKIRELQKLTSSQKDETNKLIQAKLEIQNEANRLNIQVSSLNDQCESYKIMVNELNSREHMQANKQVIRDLDYQILDLKKKLNHDDEENKQLHQDKNDLLSVRDSQRRRINTLEDELKILDNKYSSLTKEHTGTKSLLKEYEQRLSSLQTDFRITNEELERLRFQLSRSWNTPIPATGTSAQEDLIEQSQKLHMETQQLLKSQRDTYDMEIKSLQRQLFEQERLIADYQQQLCQLRTTTSTAMAGTSMGGSCFIDRASSPVRELQRRGRSLSRGHESSHLNERNKLRSKSEPRVMTNEDSCMFTVPHERKLDVLKSLLLLKDEELKEIKHAHQRRLERLQALQSAYRLQKKQLKLVEGELNCPRRKRRRIPRADIKSLQKEDSDGVWNELAFFRKENKDIMTENANLHEEVDILRVQTAQDKATIHELRCCLDTEREELQLMAEQHEQYNRLTDQEIALGESRKEVKKLQKLVKSLQDENNMLFDEKQKFGRESRDIKDQVNKLHQENAKQRIKIADLNRELSKMNRELRKSRKLTGRSSAGRQYQRLLNSSIANMKETFDRFPDDGWEEVSESEEIAQASDLTNSTSESLGQAIVDTANSSSGNIGQADRHIHGRRKDDRLARNEQPKIKSKSVVFNTNRRDIALSPIHMLGSGEREMRNLPREREKPRVVSVGTSPHSLNVVSNNAMNSASNNYKRQGVPLKQRIHTLQQQISLLKTCKVQLSEKNSDLTEQVAQLTADNTATNQKLLNSRLAVQRLTTDLDVVRNAKKVLEQQLQEYSEVSGSNHSEQEWTLLQSRLKVAKNDLGKQLNQVKELKTENIAQSQLIQQLQERISHMDRDLSQKRTLIDDMRIKLRFAQENAQIDADVMAEVETKMKNLTEINNRNKSQIESLKQRVSAAINDKHTSEEKVVKLSEELERKSKQSSDLQRKNSELQSTIVAIERTAQEQMHILAGKSEEALDTAQTRLQQTNSKIQEHEKFVKVFARAVLHNLQQTRLLVQQQEQIQKAATMETSVDLDRSLDRAQGLARTILNISQNDLDDIMSVKVNRGKIPDKIAPEQAKALEDAKRDKKWLRKLDKILETKTDFAVSMTDIFMEKFQERNTLAAKLHA